MGVLAGIAGLALAGVALAGCYSPALRDCTVSCASPDDCAAGQVCGADGMCAAPEVAGRCAMLAPDPDAGVPPVDAPSPIDPPVTVRLTVQIMGKGKVDLQGIGTCSSQDPQKGNCAYEVAPGAAITAQAMQIQLDQVFTMWSSMTCSGQGPRCIFTPTAAAMIAARFEHPLMHVAE